MKAKKKKEKNQVKTFKAYTTCTYVAQRQHYDTVAITFGLVYRIVAHLFYQPKIAMDEMIFCIAARVRLTGLRLKLLQLVIVLMWINAKHAYPTIHVDSMFKTDRKKC